MPARLNIAGFAYVDGSVTNYELYSINAADLDGDGDTDMKPLAPTAYMGFGARYEDVDGNGVLDIVGTRGGSGAVSFHKLSVARLSIDAAGIVTVTESTLIDYGPLTPPYTSGMFLLAEDFDGDAQRDYLYSYTYSLSLVSYRSRFPAFTQTNTNSLQLNNKIFVG